MPNNNQIIRPNSNLNGGEVDIKQKSLFARLKRLFSSGVVVRNVGGKKLKIKDTSDMMYATDRNSLRDRFNRVRSTSYNAYTRDFSLAYQAARIDLFRDYDTMDLDPLLSSALDIYSEECLTANEMGKMLVVNAEDNNIKEILNNLYYDILNIEHNLWSWVRNTCKYGDFYIRLHISPEYGIYQIEPISAYNVERLENTDPLNKNYVKFQIRPTDTAQVETLEDFECAHFRLLSDANFLPYGKCLSGLTSVSCKEGPKYIKDINIGDIVYSFDYDTKQIVSTKVLNKIMSGIKKTYEVKTTHRKIYATYEHPIMIKDGSYKQVRDLSLNDWLILPTIENNDDFVYPKLLIEETENWKYDKKLKIIPENTLKQNFKDLVRFFGFMLGDGWSEKDSGVSFSIGDRLDKSSKYIDFIKKLNISYSIQHENTTKASFRIHSVYFKKIMEECLGFKTGTINKEIPNWVWKLPNEYKKELLFGFSDADGCDVDDNTFQLGGINEKLIDDLRQLAMECGISTTKKWITTRDGWSGKKCTMYLFTYKLTSRDFKNWENGHHIEKIKSIKECNKEEVYDIQVDNNFHNFIADGLVVHNSMIEGARRIWKQLSLSEDAMLIHRIMRAPEKRIFKLDVGNLAPQEIDSFMEKAISKMKKVPYVDPQTGDYNLRFNLQNMVEDFYLPVRGSDSGTSIETLSGMEFTGIDDIEYLRNKLMSALKIPKAFLGYDAEMGGKSTLASEDLRFARTIQRIQKTIISELEKIGIVHLYSQGYRDESLVNFKLELTNPSTIFEKEKIEIWSNKTDLAKYMMETKLFPKKWIYQHVFNLSSDDSDELLNQIVEDSKQAWRLKSIEEEGNDPAKPFQKINPEAEISKMNGGGSHETMGELPSEMGSLGGINDINPSSIGGNNNGPESIEQPLKEMVDDFDTITNNTTTSSLDEKHGEHADDYVRPSQEGKKNSNDYPMGEDPLGNLTNNRDTRRLHPKKIKTKSPLALETFNKSNFLLTLSMYMDKNKSEKKELLKESQKSGIKSLMDESNIIKEEQS